MTVFFLHKIQSRVTDYSWYLTSYWIPLFLQSALCKFPAMNSFMEHKTMVFSPGFRFRLSLLPSVVCSLYLMWIYLERNYEWSIYKFYLRFLIYIKRNTVVTLPGNPIKFFFFATRLREALSFSCALVCPPFFLFACSLWVIHRTLCFFVRFCTFTCTLVFPPLWLYYITSFGENQLTNQQNITINFCAIHRTSKNIHKHLYRTGGSVV